MTAKAKTVALVSLRIVVGLMVWCGLMLLYLKTYDSIEKSAVPVMLATKDFTTSGWDDGSFSAKGSSKINRPSRQAMSYRFKRTR